MKKEESNFFVNLVKYDFAGKPYYITEDGSHRDLTEFELKQLENFNFYKKLMSPQFIRPVALIITSAIMVFIIISAIAANL